MCVRYGSCSIGGGKGEPPMKKLNKLIIPTAAALALAVAPAWADDSETRTRVEQRTETDGPMLGTERSRSVETRTQHDDDDDTTTTIKRDERLSAGGNTVEKRTEEKVEHDD
jgi:hypothetical protein